LGKNGVQWGISSAGRAVAQGDRSKKNMYHVYVLKSQKNQRRYTGSTARLDERIVEHNRGKSRYDQQNRPFVLIHIERFGTRSEAIKRERYLKTGRGLAELDSMGI
jgi:putative endonuclease